MADTSVIHPVGREDAREPDNRPAVTLDAWSRHDWSDGLQIDRLAPLETIEARTRNSTYELVILDGRNGDVLVTGGQFFPHQHARSSERLHGRRLVPQMARRLLRLPARVPGRHRGRRHDAGAVSRACREIAGTGASPLDKGFRILRLSDLPGSTARYRHTRALIVDLLTRLRRRRRQGASRAIVKPQPARPALHVLDEREIAVIVLRGQTCAKRVH